MREFPSLGDVPACLQAGAFLPLGVGFKEPYAGAQTSRIFQILFRFARKTCQVSVAGLVLAGIQWGAWAYAAEAPAEETEDAISVAALLQNEDLLDALIMGEQGLDPSISVSQSHPVPDGGMPSVEEWSPSLTLQPQPEANLLDPPQSWELETTVGVGLGFKKNVLFSAYDKQDSAFTTAELESMLIRVAPRNEWQFYAYLIAENAHYFDVDGLDDEWLGLLMLQGNRTKGPWKFGLGGQYTFLEQAFSLSFEDLDLGTTKVVLNQFSLKPSLEYRVLEKAYLRVEIPVETNRFGDSDQDYHEYGVAFAAGHRLAHGWKVEARYAFENRDYVERGVRTKSGDRIVGSNLDWEDHRIDLLLDFRMGQRQEWRSKTLMRLRRVLDNGSGYDDFWMYRLQQRFIYERPTWSLSAQASFNHYDYDTQTVSSTDTDLRHRSRVSAGAELEKTLKEHTTISLGYSWENYTSNVPDDTYKVSVLSLGLGRTF